MKHIALTTIFLFMASGIFAQKESRDSIRVGNKAYIEQRYHVAESSYKAAITIDPNSKEGCYNLANTYYKQSKWDEAIKEYQRYLSLETGKPEKMSEAWHNIGNTLLKKKDLKNSMEAYKNALRLNPKDDQTRYNLAVVQKMIQDQKGKNDDQDKDKDKKDDKKDKNKDQDQQKNQDNKQDNKEKKPEEQDNQQVSQDNARQMLQAIEQDEKETQERVKEIKAAERKKQNENNRKQNKDW